MPYMHHTIPYRKLFQVIEILQPFDLDASFRSIYSYQQSTGRESTLSEKPDLFELGSAYVKALRKREILFESDPIIVDLKREPCKIVHY